MLQRPSAGRAAAVVALLAVLTAWGSLRAIAPPAPAQLDAPEEEFSASRAFLHVEALSRVPRPAATPAHAAARAYLLARLADLGLETSVQEATVVASASPGRWRVMRVHNVVALLRGRASGGTVLLASHYDSRPQTPGAGDAASGVAVILETLRALRAGGPLENDLAVLLTDGEEVDLMGARAFVAEHPAAPSVDVVLNFEARGNRGPVPMFETAAGNLDLMRLYAGAAPSPFANSFSYEVYRRMPNDTDYSVFKAAGVPGLNFAFIGGHPAYHSLLDTPGRLSLASVQQEGENGLALARRLASGPIPGAAARDAVYFNPWGRAFLLYDGRWAPAIAALLVLGVAIACWRLARAGGGAWRRLAGATGIWLLGVLGAVALGSAVWPLLRTLPGDLLRTPQGLPYDQGGFALAIVLLTASLLAALLAWRGRHLDGVELAASALCLWAAALVRLTWGMRGASYLAAWPLAFLVPALLWAAWRRPSPAVTGAALGLAALPGVALWAPVIHLSFQGLTLEQAGWLAAPTALALTLFAPALGAAARTRGWRPAAALAAAGLLLGAWLVARDRPSAARPRADTLFWVEGPGAGQAGWWSLDAEPDGWTARVLGERPERRALPAALGEGVEALYAAKGTPGLQGPAVELLGEEAGAGARRLRLALRSPRGAQVMRLALAAPAGLVAVAVDGRPLEPPPGEDLRLEYHGLPPQGFTLEVETAGELSLEVADGTYDLPPRGLRARPPHLIPRPPGWLTDSTVVARRFSFPPS